jgi:site-specific DNA-methyltransferase (adenine-specific)
MKPYYEDDAVTIYHGDAREILPAINFDVIVTDPPYGISYEQTIRTAANYGPIRGDDSTELAEWLLENYGDKPLCIFGANHFPFALPEAGRWICWDKRVVESADKMLGSPFELAWMSGPDKAGVMYRIQHGGVVNADKANGRRVHPTQKPVTLMKRIIQDYYPAAVVVDPFMGSGTTLRAAKDLERKAIGIEIEERYCDIAVERLAQGVLAL